MIPEIEKDMLKVERKVKRLSINSERLLKRAWKMFLIEEKK